MGISTILKIRIERETVNKKLGGEKKKMKNEISALLEIAIVLCSVFLVALPTIAADQNQEMQEVSANTITIASEDDYVLGVYGNANEDDTIDMRDLTYVKLIFFGKKPETELADAKYDGKINPLDFIQIKLIIVGKEKELTIVDTADRIVTVKKPIKRVVLLSVYAAEAIRILRAQDKAVCVVSTITQDEVYLPELSKLPDVGMSSSPDYELILSLNPDLVLVLTRAAEHAEKLPSIAVVHLQLWKPGVFIEELVKAGYIFGKKDEAKCYIDDFHDKYLDLIKARTEGLPEEKRPKVYVGKGRREDPYHGFGAKSGAQQMIDLCGGRNIFADHDVSRVIMDPEEIIKRNPDIIIKYIPIPDAGYECDDTSKIKALWEDIMNRPELAKVNAVEHKRVYIINNGLNYGLDNPIALTYWAKWFHPDLFEDFDPRAIHQEYLTEFQGLDYDLDEHGVFVYHPEEHPEGH